jgi:hypothetical protein
MPLQTTPIGFWTIQTSSSPLWNSLDLLTYTYALHSGISLRFLVHFLGDVHQPLHLTNRERGGNGDPVRFEGRLMNLHSLWDTALTTKAIREQSNYSTPLPSYATCLPP